MLDFSHCRLPPFQHQREDTAWLLEHPFAFIASEMRTGKTKIVIDAAQFLFEDHRIDKVIVITPAPVRDVWADSTLGEIAKHAWKDTPNKVVEYHEKVRVWTNMPESKYFLHWYVSNFEFLRSPARLNQLLGACGPTTLLVGDESSFLKNYTTLQTKAFRELRKRCRRVVLLNGTPIFHSPLDLFSQANILSSKILDCPYITQFKAKYAVQEPVLSHGGKPLTTTVGKGKFTKKIIIQRVAGWSNLDDIERRFKPYTVRRLQADCLDLPPKLDPVTLTATLGVSWPHYKNMRDEFVVWLQNGKVVTSATAAIKTLRLSQITGGFLSGVEDAGIEPLQEGLLDSLVLPGLEECYGCQKSNGDYHEQNCQESSTSASSGTSASLSGHLRGDYGGADGRVQEVGREKLDVLLWFIEQQLEADPNLHLVAWGRFRAEVFRAVDEVKKKFPQFETAVIIGSQKKAERLHALSLLKPETSPKGPVFVAGIEGTGSFGLDMCAAHTCVTMSSGYSFGRTAQTLDRVYGPGQKHPIAYYNIVAVGPKGQKTIDHDILTARLNGEDIATRTAAAWVKALTREE